MQGTFQHHQRQQQAQKREVHAGAVPHDALAELAADLFFGVIDLVGDITTTTFFSCSR